MIAKINLKMLGRQLNPQMLKKREFLVQTKRLSTLMKKAFQRQNSLLKKLDITINSKVLTIIMRFPGQCKIANRWR